MCWDIYNALSAYRSRDLSIDTFGKFLDEEYTLEHLNFYMYDRCPALLIPGRICRSCVLESSHIRVGQKEAQHPDWILFEQALGTSL